MPVIIVVINNAARIAIINNNNDGLPGGLQLPPDEATPVRRAVHGAECAGSELGRSEVQVDERNRPPASALCLPASSEPWHRSGSPREAKTAFSFLVLKSRPEQARIRVLLGGGGIGAGGGGRVRRRHLPPQGPGASLRCRSLGRRHPRASPKEHFWYLGYSYTFAISPPPPPPSCPRD